MTDAGWGMGSVVHGAEGSLGQSRSSANWDKLTEEGSERLRAAEIRESADDALFEIRSSATSPDTYMSEAGFAAALADHDAAVRADQIARDTEKIKAATRAKDRAEAELRLQLKRSDKAWEIIETDYWRNHYDALVAENNTLTAQLEAAQGKIEAVALGKILE